MQTKNFVEIGRVAIIHSGPEKGKFAVIVNVVDHKRVLIDSPQESGEHAQYTALKRQVYSTRHLRLTRYRLVIRFDENHDVITGLWAKNNLTRRLLSTKYMIRKFKTEKVLFLFTFFQQLNLNFKNENQDNRTTMMILSIGSAD